jgi:predicted DCC family thiol-disulfide oxidoreductase YuxK
MRFRHADTVRPTLLYDGGCRFCRFAARAVARLDSRRRLAVLPFSDPEAVHLLRAVPESERIASSHLVFPDGGRASRGRGAVELLRLLPVTRPIAPLLRPLPLDALYHLIARRRRSLGRLVPDRPGPRRT